MSTRLCGSEEDGLLLASAPVQRCPSLSERVTKPQKIFANDALYQLSYTPEISGRHVTRAAGVFKKSDGQSLEPARPRAGEGCPEVEEI
jgi:hypothetical protein